MRRIHITLLLVGCLLLWSACSAGTASDDNDLPTAAPETAGPAVTRAGGSLPEPPPWPEPGDECPVTIPEISGFVPPEPYPEQYPHDGAVWYGTDELWTVLALDGGYLPRKSVWWSAGFPGGDVEERPDLHVSWTRLWPDEAVVLSNGGRATNAFIDDEGWFMIGGLDPGEPGCWLVEATYRGASLAYVFEVD